MKSVVNTLCAIGMTSGLAYANPQPITKEEILAAQKAWGDGLVAIGRVYQNEGDYKKEAIKQIQNLYAYNLGPVLFKPTLVSQVQFRTKFDQALSYFVEGEIKEDKGFALKPWANVRFRNYGIIINQGTALAMGNYYFTPVDSDEETKVEYSFGYIKDREGKLRIQLHHSSLPYIP